MTRIIKYLVFSLLPVAFLFLLSEIILRAFSLDRPFMVGGGLGLFEQTESLEKPDPDLGWILKPSHETGVTYPRPNVSPMYYHVQTNRLGLRSPEVEAKKADEFRILSLGESTTFGIGVDDGATYSALLEKMLRQASAAKAVTVINAGVSAYSSYQSLAYLKLRGLRLKPDLILFYHELNDYLPTTIRDTAVTGLDIMKSDRQIYASLPYKISAWLLGHSAVYRFMTYRYVGFRIDRLEKAPGGPLATSNPLVEIGLPQHFYNKAGYLSDPGGTSGRKPVYPMAFGRRVTDDERLANLTELLSICRREGIHLVIIHPAYLYTKRHECILTRFCRDNRVPMLEAYDTLHPPGTDPQHNYLYLDTSHPSVYGHQSLAKDLTRLIMATVPRLSSPP